MESANEVDDRRARFEAKLSGLEGRRLTAVDYWDLHNFGTEAVQWDYGDWHSRQGSPAPTNGLE